MTLPERRREDQEENLDRRKISEDSLRHLAEAIHFGDPDAALHTIFEILTGDVVEDHPPVRDIEGEISLGPNVQLADNRSVVLTVMLGEQTTQVYVSSSGGAYRFGELLSGDYSLSATVKEVREYDEQTMESTTYDVTDSILDIEAQSVTVDPQQVEIWTAVTGPVVTITALTIDEQSGGN